MSSSALNIGNLALNANLSALQVIGHNIANANTAGYSRQNVSMVTAGYQTLGGNFYGMGVQIDSVTRSHDAYLTREAQLASAVSSADAQRLARLNQLENLFPTGENGLGAALNDMLNAWSDVSTSPTNLAARSAVLSQSEEFAARLRDTAGQVDMLASSARQQIGDTVTNINRLAKDIAKLNQQVIESQGDVGTPNDLLDQRDSLIGELSKYVQVTTLPADDGSYSVFVAGSQPLVLGSKASSLAVKPGDPDASRPTIVFQSVSTTMDLPDSALGGELGGVLEFLNTDLHDVQNVMGRMALATNTLVNTQHQLGVDLRGDTGTDFFVPIADAAGLAAGSNTGNATLHAEVSDPTALRASDYQLNFTAAGVDIVRLSDGESTSFAGLPADLDGLSFQLDAGAGAPGDSFLVKPFANVARNMQMSVSAADRLAVASPVVVSPASGNIGGVSVQSMYPVAPSANLTDPVTLTFLANGSFTATGLGPGNPPPDNAGPPASYNYTPGKPIVLNGWSLTLRGVPAAGDSFAVTPSPSADQRQNAGNAVGVLALRDLATFDGASLSEGYASLLTDMGTRVQGAKFAADYSGSVASSAESARAAVAGVNLDEEAARLLQFQQAYQAAAKYMQIAQGMFDTLLQTVR
ncbi:flagellar hook-associated protein FlgK [Hydrogenophaga sp. MI9]|uniref:flagellar hook-associated protein FlgK n=1 Tax=Hydrogenophaga sp. MI9 TaxID=3453719 RepID=UPI003EE828BA